MKLRTQRLSFFDVWTPDRDITTHCFFVFAVVLILIICCLLVRYVLFNKDKCMQNEIECKMTIGLSFPCSGGT